MRRPNPRGTPARASRSIPGRSAAARMNARKTRARTSFQSASATATIAMTIRVERATRCAVCFMTGIFRRPAKAANAMITSAWERVCLDERRHAVVLAGPFVRALGLASVGIGLMAIGWPVSIIGVLLQAAGAFVALRAVWSWEQTRVVL